MKYELTKNDLGNLYVAPIPFVNSFNSKIKAEFYNRMDESLGRNISNKWFEPSWQSYATHLFRVMSVIDPL